jgi:HPt (histidine-containing phosphotransfer) domain-containing protein
MSVHIPKPVSWPTLFATIDRLVLQSRQDASMDLRLATGTAGGKLAPGTTGSFDVACVAELRSSIGDQNTMRLLKLFALEARGRLPSQPGSLQSRKTISEEAHAFAGSAGMLGFRELAEACAALQLAEPDDSQFEQRLDHCRRARDAALRMISELIVNDEFAGPERSMA